MIVSRRLSAMPVAKFGRFHGVDVAVPVDLERQQVLWSERDLAKQIFPTKRSKKMIQQLRKYHPVITDLHREIWNCDPQPPDKLSDTLQNSGMYLVI